MNAVASRPASAPRARRHGTRRTARASGLDVRFRTGRPADASALLALIEAHRQEGHLLPRTAGDLAANAARFVLALHHRRIVGCAELVSLGAETAEIRSLVVDSTARSLGIGRSLIDQLVRAARARGFRRLTAFTHDAGYFLRRGFEAVPHEAVPEKIAHDCTSCALFRACGQHAMVLSLLAAAR